MRSAFAGYFRPTQEEFTQLWKDCFFVFDTSVLLNIYEYSQPTREALTNIMLHIKERSWLPYHVGTEFLSNRIEVISNQVKTYESSKSMLDNVVTKLEASKGHPFVPDNVLANLKRAIDQTKTEFERSKIELEKRYTTDSYLDTLAIVFEGRAGVPYPEAKMAELDEEGKRRYERQTPPGYKDKTKVKKNELDPQIVNQNNRFGDYIIWEQMIEEAKNKSKPLIFVTDDETDDCWATHQKRLIGPRPEMIEEFASRTSQRFYMYNSPAFMAYAKVHFKLDVEKEAIEEAQSVIDSRRNMRKIAETTESSLKELRRSLRRIEKELSAENYSPVKHDWRTRRLLYLLDRLFNQSIRPFAVSETLFELRSILKTRNETAEFTNEELQEYRQLYHRLQATSDAVTNDGPREEEIAESSLGGD